MRDRHVAEAGRRVQLGWIDEPAVVAHNVTISRATGFDQASTRAHADDGRHSAAPTLAERALADLHDAILSGALLPGAPLRLEHLARTLDMSPMPIREAIRELERLGLAEHVPHRGARVSRLSSDDLRDTYEARLALETLAVRQAAARFTEDDAAAAEHRLVEHVRAHKADDQRRARTAHAEFHLGLYAASGSTWLPRLIRPLWENSERYRVAALYSRRSRSGGGESTSGFSRHASRTTPTRRRSRCASISS